MMLRAREQTELLQLLIERVDYDGVSGAAAVRYAFSPGRDHGRKVLRDGPALATVPTGRVPRVAPLLSVC